MTKSSKVKVINNSADFYQSLPDKKVVLPVSIDQIPDIIIYISSGQTCYRRLKASAFIDSPCTTQLIHLQYPRNSHSGVPNVYLRLQLLTSDPDPRQLVS